MAQDLHSAGTEARRAQARRTALLLGVVSGVLGSLAVLRRQSLLGDMVSHAALPGIVLGFLITGSKQPILLMLGAAVAGWLAALAALAITRSTRIKADTALAVCLAWLFVHVAFGLYYGRLYYDEVTPGTGTADNGGATVPYCKGLEFPDGELVDYWAFMYYSFTIAMCYQTSDVTVTGSLMRRMTLLHAIVSFAFVLVILGYTVNAINTLL